MFIQFPSIVQFNNVYTRETWEGLETRRTLTYRAKIKLHGGNVSISVSPTGEVQAQSRNSIITPEDDFHNFFDHFNTQLPLFAAAKRAQRVTFYGEWAGKGIQKGDAIQQIEGKRFFIFAVGLDTAPHWQDDTKTVPMWMITNPQDIESLLPEGLDRDLIRVLPYEDETPLVFNFNDEAQVKSTLDIVNRSVEALEEKDPYISRVFGVDYRGEGFVLVPDATLENPISTEDYGRLVFKAKTDRHRVRKQGKAASAREPLPQSALDFVDTFVTPQRVAQAASEVCEEHVDMTSMGKVLAWIMADVQKEAADELAQMDIPFSKLKSSIADATRNHFKAIANPL